MNCIETMSCSDDACPFKGENFDPDLGLNLLKAVRLGTTCSDYTDVTIEVEGEIFNSHKFILSSCSGFFKGLFSSNMKESLNNHVSLKDVSRNTFRTILECLFESKNLVSKDNLIDIWKASDMLQILCLVSRCEDFASKKLEVENAVEILQTADLLSSPSSVKTAIWKFMLENFDKMSEITTSGLLSLSYIQLKTLIKYNDLKTESEDKVIRLVIEKITSSDNYICSKAILTSEHGEESESTEENKESRVIEIDKYESRIEEMLMELLLSCRLILASQRYLDHLREKNQLVSKCPKVKELLKSCILWKRDGCDINNAYLDISLCRNYDQYQNYIVSFQGERKQLLISHLKRDQAKIYATQYSTDKILHEGFDTIIAATVCNNIIFLIADNFHLYSYSLFAATSSRLVSENIVCNSDISLVAGPDCLYLVGTSIESNSVFQTEQVTVRLIATKCLPVSVCNISACLFNSLLLIFGSEPDKEDITIIQCMDVSTKDVYCLNEIKGNSSNMIVRKSLFNVFLIFGTGHLWKIEESSDTVFFMATYVTQIFEGSENISVVNIFEISKHWKIRFSSTDESDEDPSVLNSSVPGLYNTVSLKKIPSRAYPIYEFVIKMLRPVWVAELTAQNCSNT